MNVDTAQAWYLRATWEFAEQYPKQPTENSHVKLEIFVRAVIAQFFNKHGRHEFPETFYLDQDRLRTLKAEIEDLIHIEVCMDAFAIFLRQLGHNGSVSPSTRQHLYSSLLAIMGEAMGYGSYQWIVNSEALSLEILRQASGVAGRTMSYSHETLSSANSSLLQMFSNSFTTHNPRLETTLLCRVLACTNRNINSTPMDLFNNLTPIANFIPPPPTHFLHLQTSDTSTSPHTLNPETAKWQDIANRITHIIILHWRVWNRIAYDQEDGSQRSPSLSAAASTAPSPQSVQPTRPPPPQAAEQNQQVVTTMKTGEPPESGQETRVAH